MNKQDLGKVGWLDLTVSNAEEVRDFYSAVAGWSMSEVPVGDYCDYTAAPSEGADPVAGICHARGENANIPPQWLMYITVADLDRSLRECESRGGSIVCPARSMGSYGRMAVVRDPAGAVAAIIQPPD